MIHPRSKEEVVQEYRIKSIQDATMRVIGRKGMAAATMQEIAEEAGVAKGTIYLYFRDREELVEKTFESAMAELGVELDEVVRREGHFEEKIRAIVSGYLSFFAKNREFFRLYLSMRLAEGSPERQRRHKAACEPRYRMRVDQFAAFLEDAMNRGQIRRGDPRRMALFIMEGTTAILTERLTEESSPADTADVDLIVGMIVEGVRKRSEA
jgi:AcrR family transcriptional regulator